MATQHEKPRPPRYTVGDIGSLTPNVVADNSVLAGLATAPDGTQHAVLWYQGRRVNIARPGLGGPNSGAFGLNQSGQVGGQAETTKQDPNHENFCAYGTGLKCVPFLWQDGVMSRLQTLGGNNGVGGVINSRGEMVGIAENRTRDSECVSPQVLDFQADLGLRPGKSGNSRCSGDSVGVASGSTTKARLSAGRAAAEIRSFRRSPPPHAVLWDKDGSVHTRHPWRTDINMALAISNHGGSCAWPPEEPPHSTPTPSTREMAGGPWRPSGDLAASVAITTTATWSALVRRDGNYRIVKNGTMHSLDDPSPRLRWFR